MRFFFKKVKKSKNTFNSLEILFKTNTSQRYKGVTEKKENALCPIYFKKCQNIIVITIKLFYFRNYVVYKAMC